MAFQTGENVWGGKADAAARRYGVDPTLFRRLITQESAWNPNAGSSAGARGLTQVVPKWHPTANLSTPESQLGYGAKHFGSLLKKYGNPRDALAVYNSGRPWSVSQKYDETNNYVTRILGGYAGSGKASSPYLKAMGGELAPATNGFTSQYQSPLGKLDASTANEIARYARESEQAVLLGGEVPDVMPLAQRVIARRKTVADTAISAVGGTAFPGGEQQGAMDGATGPVAAAQGVLGTPYSWGGGTPSGATKGFGRGANTVGFDCSSLVQYAWAKAGVNLPRTTYDQIKVGRAVPNVQQSVPGDLLFPHTGHVMLYMGNGKAIEAPRTGGRVQIVDVSSRKFVAIRRPR
jgi:cell wall-associated NlpC family hydrolase